MSTLTLLSLAALTAGSAAPMPSAVRATVARRSEVLESSYIEHLSRSAGVSAVVPDRPIPSFSRQTGLACSACHTSFPQLNAFGRFFKLNGYTMVAKQTVEAQDSGRASLRLDLIPPVSAMVISSLTSVRREVPDQQNNSVAFPQEMGIFIGESITPKLGTFLQLTYDPAEGGISIDNADIRFADHTSIHGKDVLYGVTLNNSPTVQDVWNSTPVWGYPYTSSDVAPGPMASTLIDEGLGQQVGGLGVYALWDNLVYTELSGYRSAFQGGPVPVDGSAENAIHGVSPYWRVAVQRQFGAWNTMVGTYGLVSHLTPVGFQGPRDKYTDVAFDAQVDKTSDAGATFSAHGTWISEHRHLDATFQDGGATNLSDHLHTVRLDASYLTPSRLGFTLGYFDTAGDTDPLLYPEGAVDGSSNGSPDSSGFIGEVSFMPWLNTRLGLEYVAYNRFNGARYNYDGSGRDAADNNALYIMTWLAF